jgi:hypothetical protein
VSAYDRFIEDPTYVEPMRAWLPRTTRQPAFHAAGALFAYVLFGLSCGAFWARFVDPFCWSVVLVVVALARARNTASLKPAFWSFWAGGSC